MDANRFDTLARLIGSRTSRRIAFSLGATGLLSIAAPEAEARRCSTQKDCPKCYRCRKHRCRPLTGTACGGGKTCCSGVCVDLRTDPSNCGRCDRVFDAGTCYHGACACAVAGVTCPTGCGCSTRTTFPNATAVCTGDGTICSEQPECPNGDSDCPLGSACVVGCDGTDATPRRCGAKCDA